MNIVMEYERMYYFYKCIDHALILITRYYNVYPFILFDFSKTNCNHVFKNSTTHIWFAYLRYL